MKYLFLFIAVLGFQLGFSQEKKKQIVEVACGQCQLKMKQKKGCDLAIRIDGKNYFSLPIFANEMTPQMTTTPCSASSPISTPAKWTPGAK